MALGARGFVRIGATIAGCALVAACTPDQPPAVTPTPAPSPPATASPTPAATPTETDIERQMRLDWEGAEEAYRGAVAQLNLLAQRGQANATPALKAVAAGDYLKVVLSSLSAIRSRKQRFVGEVTVVEVSRRGGWAETELTLVACEDNSTWKFLDEAGRDVTPKGQSDYIQTLTINKLKGTWKVVDVTSEKVRNVSAKDCQ